MRDIWQAVGKEVQHQDGRHFDNSDEGIIKFRDMRDDRNDIIAGFDSLTSLIAEKVINEIRQRLPELMKGFQQGNEETSKPVLPGIVRGNKGLAEVLGVDPTLICGWKKKGILDPAIKSEYGRVIIYDVIKAMECLNHKKVKPGRPRLAV